MKDTSTTSIEILPNELLINIFTYLNYKDLSSAALVSNLWRSQSKELRFIRRFEIQQQRAYKLIETIFLNTRSASQKEARKNKKSIRKKILQLLFEFYDLNQEWKKIFGKEINYLYNIIKLIKDKYSSAEEKSFNINSQMESCFNKTLSSLLVHCANLDYQQILLSLFTQLLNENILSIDCDSFLGESIHNYHYKITKLLIQNGANIHTRYAFTENNEYFSFIIPALLSYNLNKHFQDKDENNINAIKEIFEIIAENEIVKCKKNSRNEFIITPITQLQLDEGQLKNYAKELYLLFSPHAASRLYNNQEEQHTHYINTITSAFERLCYIPNLIKYIKYIDNNFNINTAMSPNNEPLLFWILYCDPLKNYCCDIFMKLLDHNLLDVNFTHNGSSLVMVCAIKRQYLLAKKLITAGADIYTFFLGVDGNPTSLWDTLSLHLALIEPLNEQENEAALWDLFQFITNKLNFHDIKDKEGYFPANKQKRKFEEKEESATTKIFKGQ